MKYAISALILFFALASCTPTDPAKTLKEAHTLMLKMEYDKALPKIRECLAVDSQNVDAIVMDAVCTYSTTDATAEARKPVRLNISRALIIAPKRFDVWYTATWMHLQDKNYNDAISAARRARELYRSQHTPAYPLNIACDKYDQMLAKENPTYANLILMYADICSHNVLTEGLPYFYVALTIKPLARIPELYISYANLYFRMQRQANAYKILKSAVNQFPRNLPCAYNFAVIDEVRRKGMRLTSTELNTIIYNYRRALKLAEEYGNAELKQGVIDHLLKIQ